MAEGGIDAGVAVKAIHREQPATVQAVVDRVRINHTASPSSGKPERIDEAGERRRSLALDALAVGDPERAVDDLHDVLGPHPKPRVGWLTEHVMQVVNSSFRMTDRQGVQSETPTTFHDFVGTFGFPDSAMPCRFDPHTIYNSLHGGWLGRIDGWSCNSSIKSAVGHGYLFFATSNTSDPTGNWTGS